MTEEKKKEKLIDRLKHKYRLTMYNDTSLEEVLNVRLSRLNVFTFFGLLLIVIGALVFVLLIYTPLKGFLPSYTDSEMRRVIVENSIRADSLEQEIRIRDQYLLNLKNIIEGKELNNYETTRDTAIHYDEISFEKSEADSMLRMQIEQEEKFNLSAEDRNGKKAGFSSLHFFAPLNKGVITNGFDIQGEHYGVDIVAAPNEGVKAILDGTVVTSTWTLETGYVIQIQHEHNLVSFYKHNSAILKKVGDRVKAGEVIAIIGNSGELTTGPHLHFELWHNGIPLNPEDYIVF